MFDLQIATEVETDKTLCEIHNEGIPFIVTCLNENGELILEFEQTIAGKKLAYSELISLLDRANERLLQFLSNR